MLRTSIHYFAAVVKHGSIRAAAETLHIAQSAISRQLQALEHEVGASLFERRARGVVLTDAGEILNSYVRGALFEVERVRSEIEALRGLHRGHVRVCTVESHIDDFVSESIDRFRSSHPGVAFQVATAGSDRVVQSIRSGEADIGICFNQDLTPDIRCVYQQREGILAVMTPTHPLASLRNLSLAQLAEWPVGLSMRWSGTRKLIDTASAGAGIAFIPILETNSISLLHRFALSGQGIAFLVKAACIDSLSMRRLVAVPLKDPILNNAETKVITLPHRQLPVAAEAFMAQLCGSLDKIRDGAMQTKIRRAARGHRLRDLPRAK
jgi:DNA-binding transcriptional LysR family regulator